MNQQDFAQLRRRLNPEKRNPSSLLGCYFATDGTVLSDFRLNIGTMTDEENQRYMGIFKKVLTGTQGQNITAIDFSPEETEQGEYQLLAHLRDTKLRDEDVLESLWLKASQMIAAMAHALPESVENAQNACNYLLLVMFDGCDIPARDANGEIDRENSTRVFSYIVGALCPVKKDKPELCHDGNTGEFHLQPSQWTAAMPEKGFLFPAFEEGGANVSRSIYYSRKTDDRDDLFLNAFFGEREVIPPEEQLATMQQIMQETLGSDCRMDVVQGIHDSVKEIVDEKKADKKAETPTVSCEDMQEILVQNGISQEKAAKFGEKYEEAFGKDCEIPAVNAVKVREFKVNTPDVTIRVNPERSDLIETRVIDGKRYILVLADGDVEVNGMRVSE